MITIICIGWWWWCTYCLFYFYFSPFSPLSTLQFFSTFFYLRIYNISLFFLFFSFFLCRLRNCSPPPPPPFSPLFFKFAYTVIFHSRAVPRSMIFNYLYSRRFREFFSVHTGTTMVKSFITGPSLSMGENQCTVKTQWKPHISLTNIRKIYSTAKIH